MVLHRRERRWEHQGFTDILDYLHPNDLLVLNDAEADLIEVEGRKVPPLPPYIKRKKPEDFTEEDYQRYRTVYASTPGSKAAPTAGFHFTEEILETLRQKGVETRFLTLHVSYDTYKPIRSEQIEDHTMHGEEYLVPEETAKAVLSAKKEMRRVIAVGTTVVRALESWALMRPGGPLTFPAEPAIGSPLAGSPSPALSSCSTSNNGLCGAGLRELPRKPSAAPQASTKLFIKPGFQFRVINVLLTNFHRPRSTVLVMVSAFAGRELILQACAEAIRERYRLFSYGDCMLIL